MTTATTLLASFPSPPRGVWHLGWLPIRAYAFFIIVGIIVALVIGDRRWADRGGERGVIYDIALWAVPFGLVGGRLYHVITDWQTYFGDEGKGFIAALRIWDGGLGIWGAVALGGVGAWIGCRQRGIPLPAFGDAIAPGIVLAQAIGRLGNYFNQELYGRTTAMPWGMKIYERRDPSGLIDVHSMDGISTGQVHSVVQPTFLYELIWNVLVFVLLIYVDRRFKLGHGRLFALYVASYCVGRFWVELLRNDHATLIAGIRINSFTSTFVFIGAIVYIVLAPKGREDPATLAGKPREPKAEEPKVEEPKVEKLKEPVTAEDSALVEWTKDLAAAASTSGVVAGVVVAAEDDEDEAEGESAEVDAESMEPDQVPDADELAEGDEAAEPDEHEESEDVAEEAEEPEEEPAEAESVEPEQVSDEEPAEAEASEDVVEAAEESAQPAESEAEAEEPAEEAEEEPDEAEASEDVAEEADEPEEQPADAETDEDEDEDEEPAAEEGEATEAETEAEADDEAGAPESEEPGDDAKAETSEDEESTEERTAQSLTFGQMMKEATQDTGTPTRRFRLPRFRGRGR